MAGIPPEIKAIVEFAPIEDVIIPIIRAGLPGISVQTQIWDDQEFPFVLVRRSHIMQSYQGDPRFTDWCDISVHALVADPDGDQDAAILSDAVRVVLRDAATQRLGVPGLGYLTRADMTQGPSRRSDWATATGPVQYADLPTACWRYESRFEIEIRRSNSRPYPLTPP